MGVQTQRKTLGEDRRVVDDLCMKTKPLLGLVIALTWLMLCAPSYSQSARHHDIWIVGTIRITTDATGQVVKAEIIKSSGYPKADADVAKHWLKRKQALNTTKTLAFNFHRRGDMW